jgi:hypothetical protein
MGARLPFFLVQRSAVHCIPMHATAGFVSLYYLPVFILCIVCVHTSHCSTSPLFETHGHSHSSPDPTGT